MRASALAVLPVAVALRATNIWPELVMVALALPPKALCWKAVSFTNATATVIQAGVLTVGYAEGIETASSFFLMLIPATDAQPVIDASSGQFMWTPESSGIFKIRVITVTADGNANQSTFEIEIVPEMGGLQL